jgi:rubrerythrin
VRGETWSNQDIAQALVVLRRAIHNEITGQRFYSDAAFACIDPWAKEVFATLAREEQVHTRLLLLEHEALTTQGRWLDLEMARTSNAEVDIARFDFPDDEQVEELFPLHASVEQIVDRRVDDLDALAVGIKMEKAAIDLYSRAATATGDPVARETYGFLVEEETRHYHQLRSQWEDLAGTAFVAS